MIRMTQLYASVNKQVHTVARNTHLGLHHFLLMYSWSTYVGIGNFPKQHHQRFSMQVPFGLKQAFWFNCKVCHHFQSVKVSSYMC